MNQDILLYLLEWCAGLVHQYGYIGIFIAMAIESSVLPLPSEIVMIPAGYLASRGEMSIIIASVCGALGSCFGAYLNYLAALKLGRPFLYRYGKYFLFPPKKLDSITAFFVKHGEISTFTGRLIPVIRHFISIPAGLSGMRLTRFFIFTFSGSLIWMLVLVLFGYFVGSSIELFHKYSFYINLGVFFSIAVLIALYIIWKKGR